MPKRLSVSERLGADTHLTDKESHLKLSDPNLCRACRLKPCIAVCPAKVYEWDTAQDKLLIHFENCLELGACRIACQEMGNKALLWEFPKGSRGVQFRFG